MVRALAVALDDAEGLYGQAVTLVLGHRLAEATELLRQAIPQGPANRVNAADDELLAPLHGVRVPRVADPASCITDLE